MAKINAVLSKYKVVLSFLIMLPYLVIGFSEGLTELKFDENFKANMWYVCIVGLSVPFGSEMLIIFKAYTSGYKIVRHEDQQQEKKADDNR